MDAPTRFANRAIALKPIRGTGSPNPSPFVCHSPSDLKSHTKLRTDSLPRKGEGDSFGRYVAGPKSQEGRFGGPPSEQVEGRQPFSRSDLEAKMPAGAA